MGCEGCGTAGSKPKGCGNNGYCESGGCSRLEVFDWLADITPPNHEEYDLFEVSFKNGARKEIFRNDKKHDIVTGDYVLVETQSIGYDVGRVTLGGELVRLQMKKKNIGKRGSEVKNIIRKARDGEMEKLEIARSKEKETMLRARVMARDLGLDMKLGDVEFQADLRKATFFYVADGRVDFRELIKVLAREFKVKIEMRQIGARQEAGRVGGIGACGRELCCSSWLTNFKSVNTTAARYQNLAINQTKLSGQCGRLKCCLNYELDTYLDALRHFPDTGEARKLNTAKGTAFLVKTDILKGVMTYQLGDGGSYVDIALDDVKMILEMNARGEQPEDLEEMAVVTQEKEVMEFEDVVGQISLQSLERSDRKKHGRNRNRKGKGKDKGQKRTEGSSEPQNSKGGQGGGNQNRNRNSRRRKNRPKGGGETRQN